MNEIKMSYLVDLSWACVRTTGLLTDGIYNLWLLSAMAMQHSFYASVVNRRLKGWGRRVYGPGAHGVSESTASIQQQDTLLRGSAWGVISIIVFDLVALCQIMSVEWQWAACLFVDQALSAKQRVFVCRAPAEVILMLHKFNFPATANLHATTTGSQSST